MKDSMQDICISFPITEMEYAILEKEIGNLCEYAAWQLFKRNSRNNHTNEQADISQDLKISLMRAASYYKRQSYIEACLELCSKNAKDKFMKYIVQELMELWANKTRHGANRQKFGPFQERILEKIVKKTVKKSKRPSRTAALKIDSNFLAYCKGIMWNEQRAIGKKITKEKGLRGGMVSINEFEYLGAY